MSTGVMLLMAGAVIICCSILFAVHTVVSVISSHYAGSGTGAYMSDDEIFKRHLGAIAGIVCGTLVSFVGVVMLLLPYLK